MALLEYIHGKQFSSKQILRVLFCFFMSELSDTLLQYKDVCQDYYDKNSVKTVQAYEKLTELKYTEVLG